MKPHRVLSLLAAVGLFAALIPATTSLVLAWSAPSIASVCSNDQAVHTWTVTLSTEANYDIQWADNAGFVSPTNVTLHAGANSVSTPTSVTTLFVRWASDHSSKSSAAWSGSACSTPTPPPTASPTPFESFQGATGTPTIAPTTSPSGSPMQAVELTLIKVLCPSYSVVPANNNPTAFDHTGGHGSQLDTSYQTALVNPTTDIPKTCARADGWKFQLYGALTSGVLAPTVGSPLTTGADGAGSGSVSIWLDPSELALAQTVGSPAGLWVSEIEKPSMATFGALRCYTDIIYGDNVENIRNVGSSNQHIYCIAYNVVVSQPTPTPPPTATPVVTGTPCVLADAKPALSTVTSCPTPFESFQGETATPTIDPTSTPFESFQGETATAKVAATPPPTSTGGDGSSNSSTPLFALLIGLAFGGLGLTAVEAQRRSIRR